MKQLNMIDHNCLYFKSQKNDNYDVFEFAAGIAEVYSLINQPSIPGDRILNWNLRMKKLIWIFLYQIQAFIPQGI
ncbi:hypothetical protein pb186bvf_009209 [Paramecium bursaria]